LSAGRRALWAWALYDLANTTFSLNVISRYLPLIVVQDLVGPITGAALGATWAADRVLMLRLSPPEALGELYGVYGMVGRFSAITGPLLWGAIVYLLEGTGALAYRAAVASLLAMLLAGAFVLAPVEE